MLPVASLVIPVKRWIALSLLILSIIGFSACTSFLPVNRWWLSFAAAPPDALYAQVWQAVTDGYVDTSFNHQAWPQWRHRFDGRLKTMEDAYVAADTMLASLNDDYSRLLRPREMSEQSMTIDARLYGVGLQIAVKNKQLTVVAPLENTPADRAGLRPGDVITQVNHTSTQGMPVEEAANRIRGPQGSRVQLQIRRGAQLFIVQLKRAEIRLKAVTTRVLPHAPGIAYIRLSTFISENAQEEMATALRHLVHPTGLILDLRSNYGGLLTNAVSISDMFLDSGTIVRIEDRQHHTQTVEAEPGELFRGPMVVLIDHGSASASEIFAGAMKDHHRATLVGSQSFGKGLVQRVMPLSGGSGLNLTVSRYRTPNGTDIHTKGIHPDRVVDWTLQDVHQGRDPQLEAAIALLSRTH